MTDGKQMGSSYFQTQLADAIMLVVINRPEKKNAFTLSMWTELGHLFRGFAADPSVAAVVVTGEGGSFSAGADIAEFNAVRANSEQTAAFENQVDACLAAIAAIPKPTIAAVSGICVGGGVALAASFDFRVADATAQFSIAAARMGLAYNIAKCSRLYSLVGLSAAKRILLTGRRFDAVQARNWGLVDEIATGTAKEAAMIFAKELTLSAPLAVSGMKQILESLADGSVERDQEKLERAILAADASADHREAVTAFVEKRRPIFRGM